MKKNLLRKNNLWLEGIVWTSFAMVQWSSFKMLVLVYINWLSILLVTFSNQTWWSLKIESIPSKKSKRTFIDATNMGDVFQLVWEELPYENEELFLKYIEDIKVSAMSSKYSIKM